MTSSAFSFHLISAIVIVVLVFWVVRLQSKLNIMHSYFEVLKFEAGVYKRRNFVNHPQDFLRSFCQVFAAEFKASGIVKDLKKINVSALLKLHFEHQILSISCASNTLSIVVKVLPNTSDQALFKKLIGDDFLYEEVLFLELTS